jgi:DNA polymerase-3 subunit alpha/error-prone DNA polymerase
MFPLRVRSCYSLLRGTAQPAALCRLARQYGYPGLALTDCDNLYGLWSFLAACRREELRPVIGAEISEPGGSRRITCLVETDSGYRSLCRLLSRRHAEAGFDLVTALPEEGDGLIPIGDDLPLLDELWERGLRPVADLGPRPTESGSRLRKWARDRGAAAVITPASRIAGEDERELYRLVRAIANNTSLSRLPVIEPMAEVHSLLGPEDYRHRFAVWPEAIEATLEVAERCVFTGPDFGTVMPPWRGGGEREAAPVLRRKAYAGARRRYGDDLGEPVVERLEHELRIIAVMGYSSYFLVVRDIVHRRGEDGRRIRRRICGRGSGAASLVAYCLDITNVCPIRHNLYFERFLNPGRSDPPDIDIDFAWDERDRVLADILRDHAGRAAMVCNHVCFQPRMAIRETAKVFGLPDREISQMTRRLPWIYRRDGDSLQEQLQQLPSLADQDFAEPWPEILRLASRLIGLPRCLSVHPGGVVITPGPTTDYVPVEFAAKGVPIIHWEKDGAEEAGLVKIDILGNRSLGVIRDCIAALRRDGRPFDERNWRPEDDLPTGKTIARGRTMGCFYIESPAMRLLEQKAGSGDFEQLVIQSSIIRPAANEFVREYVRRLHGGSWQPLHPAVGDILDETYGLMVYQEDVAKVAVVLAGFSHAQADGLRKVMSKKDKVAQLKDYRQRFFDGSRQRGVGEEDIERMWRMMLSFDGYSFCKPHSASYARVSFQAAYLKCHHPAEFMAAVISNQGGYYSTFAYVSEAKRLGLAILPPDVNCSDYAWKGVDGEALRVGLQSVAGLSAAFVDRLSAAGSRQPFVDPADFWLRTRPADDEARALIHAGAMDSLAPGISRTALLWQWAAFLRLREMEKAAALFPAVLPDPPPLPPPDRLTMLRREYEVLGFLCADHPVALCGRLPPGLVKVDRLGGLVGRRVRCAVWLLTGKLVSTRTGEAMEFLTFEDETGVIEATFFPQVYRRHAHLLRSGRAYILSGLVEQDYGAITLTVEKAIPHSTG